MVRCYDHGEGVAADAVEAAQLFNRAADAGVCQPKIVLDADGPRCLGASDMCVVAFKWLNYSISSICRRGIKEWRLNTVGWGCCCLLCFGVVSRRECRVDIRAC